MRANVILGIGGAALVAALVVGESTRTSEPADAIESARQYARGARPELRERDAVGEQRTYDTHATFEIALAEGRFAIELDGTWQLAVVRADAKSLLVRSGMTVKATANGNTHAELAAQLAKPHYFELAANGALEAVRFHDEHDNFARGVAQTLGASIQIVGTEAPQWETEEGDSTGRYVASYRRDGAMIDKTKLRYVAAPPGAQITIVESKTRIRREGADWPTTLTSNEHIAIAGDGMQMVAKTRIALELANVERIDVAAIELAGYRTQPLGRALNRRATAAEDRDLLAGATLDDLLAELTKVDADSAAMLSARFAAIVRRDGAAAHQLAERVIAGVDSEARNVLLAALGEAGTREAQAALVHVLEADIAADHRVSAIAAMMHVEQPEQAMTDALNRALDSKDGVADAAALALGGVAARLRASDDPRNVALVDDLLARLAAATTVEQQVALIRALGNTGDARGVPALRVLLASPNTELRLNAVEALRGMPGADVDLLIANTLAGDRDAGVRRSAVLAARDRAFESVRAVLARALGADVDTGVRMAIVELLGAHAAQPEASRLLADAAKSDPSPDVRAEASRYL